METIPVKMIECSNHIQHDRKIIVIHERVTSGRKVIILLPSSIAEKPTPCT